MTDEVRTIDEAGEIRTEKRPRTTFEMIGLTVSTKIMFKNQPNEFAVVSDSKNQVKYKGEGKAISISSLAEKLVREAGAKVTATALCIFTLQANGFLI